MCQCVPISADRINTINTAKIAASNTDELLHEDFENDS